MEKETFNTVSYQVPKDIRILGTVNEEYARVFTPDVVRFLTTLEREFGERRLELLKKRVERQTEINTGKMPDFLPATKQIRESYWRVSPSPQDLMDRRVEITGPTNRKMIINALNSGANVYMADFEDSNSPTWDNMVRGQFNLCDAVDRTISYVSPEGKKYELGEQIATLMVRPRGLHLIEKNFLVNGRPISASLFDFGIFFFHNARKLLERGTGPYFYLPKLENHLEARLWNDIFSMAQDELSIPRGSIRATVLIETILAAFEMHEILYELRDHSAGLNCGRWDYIFSFIKKFRHRQEFVLPDRSRLTMMAHFLHSYSLLLIQTCHKRGTHAMGGMAAQIPIKNDPQANEAALMRVIADKEREVDDGHDGTWVAHPLLVPIAKAVFDASMTGPNQLNRKREDVFVDAGDLLTVPKGDITEEGFRRNINVALQYIEAWLRGNGCVPIYNLMEDTATAEICRAQIWQWIHHPHVTLSGKRRISRQLYEEILLDEVQKIRSLVGEDQFRNGKYALARSILTQLVLDRSFEDFLTVAAYVFLD